MPDETLVFTGAVDYGDYSSFSVTVDAAGIQCAISFSGYADAFQDFGGQLVNFPINTQAEVCFQQGEDIGSGLEYLLLKAYYLDRAGHAALRIEMDNKARPPRERRVAFSLAVEVASLIGLGKLLINWQLHPGPASSIIWHPIVS